jgi:hypothetical protein
LKGKDDRPKGLYVLKVYDKETCPLHDLKVKNEASFEAIVTNSNQNVKYSKQQEQAKTITIETLEPRNELTYQNKKEITKYNVGDKVIFTKNINIYYF